ncbi:hypothetical protein [Clostridium butyricum]|uniref:hypothetical protein n=1 Tax=Clostridium butyricum TaxID=1492 RepID=UPI00041471EC|nr:hypothetical protein [Clostridium butyricum]
MEKTHDQCIVDIIQYAKDKMKDEILETYPELEDKINYIIEATIELERITG